MVVNERWDFARQYANRLIGAAEAIHSLPGELGTIVPNEAVAREVAKIPAEHRETVVREAVARPVDLALDDAAHNKDAYYRFWVHSFGVEPTPYEKCAWL